VMVEGEDQVLVDQLVSDMAKIVQQQVG
jgi:hypothetical protein